WLRLSGPERVVPAQRAAPPDAGFAAPSDADTMRTLRRSVRTGTGRPRGTDARDVARQASRTTRPAQRPAEPDARPAEPDASAESRLIDLRAEAVSANETTVRMLLSWRRP